MFSLRRKTSAGIYVAELDGLRFVAIVSVVVYHLHGYLATNNETIASLGWTGQVSKLQLGVQLFFMISGMVLALPWSSRRFEPLGVSHLRGYFVRRIYRVEPPYLLAIITLGLLMAVREGVELGHWLASLSYTHYWFYGEASPILPVAWSLEVEVQFYLLAPLIMMVFAIERTSVRRSILILAMLIFAAGRQWTSSETSHWQHGWTLIDSAPYFLGGILMADLWCSGKFPRRSGSLVSDGLVLASVVAVWLVLDSMYLHHIFLPMLMSVGMCAALRGHLCLRFLRLDWVSIIGGMCYTIYLYHFATLAIVGGIIHRTVGLNNATGLAMAGVALPSAIAIISCVLFVTVERPFMGVRRLADLRSLWHRPMGGRQASAR